LYIIKFALKSILLPTTLSASDKAHSKEKILRAKRACIYYTFVFKKEKKYNQKAINSIMFFSEY